MKGAMLKKAYRENIAKVLHHSILQLFNDQVTYKSDLQILGVLCLTIDHEEQEILIKVNNTLRKRSGNAAGKVMISLSDQKAETGGGELASNGDADEQEPMLLQPGKPLMKQGAAVVSSDEEEEESVTSSAPQQSAGSNGKANNAGNKATPRILALSEIKAYDNTRTVRTEQKRKQTAPVKISYREIRPAPPKNDISGLTIINVPTIQRHLTAHLQNTDSSSSVANSLLPPPPSLTFPQQSFFNEFYGGSYDPIDGTGSDNAETQEDSKRNFIYNGTTDTFRSGLKIKEEPLNEYPGEITDAMSNHESTNDADHGRKDGPEDLSGARGSDEHMHDEYAREDDDSNDLSLKIVSVEGGASSKMNSSGSSAHDDSLTESGGDFDQDAVEGAEVDDEEAYVPIPILHRKRKCEEMDSLILEKVAPVDGTTASMVMGKRRSKTQTYEEMINEAATHVMKRESQNPTQYTCKYCMLVFSDLMQYTQHTITQHRAYLCQLCGKTFTTKSSLFRHRSVHTGQRRFMCALCKKAFYRKDKCRAHIQCKHKIDVNTMYQM